MADAATLNMEETAARTTPPDPRLAGPASVLIIDDEAAIRDSLETLLTMEGFQVIMAVDGAAGLEQLAQREFDLVLLDLALPGESGMDLLPKILEMQPGMPVIMITAFGTVSNVVEAIRAGAENFVQKPWDNEKLLADIRAAIARKRAEEEVVQLKRTLKQRYNFENIIGKSEPMLRLFDLVAQVAPSQRDHRSRHRRGEQHGLTDRGHLRHDPLDIRQEPEVEHLVGLVEHEDLHV
jgi:DNA-binding NtrC family response regulator